MQYNINNHHRRSIRLKNYDYSQDGMYFVTICTYNKKYFFGEIKESKIILNNAGILIKKWFLELHNKFNNIKLDEYIIMPNHVHCIIQIVVGADLCVCPEEEGEHAGSPLRKMGAEGEQKKRTEGRQKTREEGENTKHIPQIIRNMPLHRVVQWFKTMTTNEYIKNVKNNGWQPFKEKMWQRNYYEHIIRNEYELNRIKEYIINNPLKWELDFENPNRIKQYVDFTAYMEEKLS